MARADYVSSVDEETAAALQRITQLADVEPPRRPRRYRVAKLVAAIATWSSVAILIADVRLYDWSSWLY